MTQTKAILSKRQLPVLAGFALSNVLLAFDYDGTLSTIASTPGRARMRADTRRLLARVADSYPCVVISGRALDDISRRLHQVPLWYVFGNHGLEPSSTMTAPHVALTREWVRWLREQLRDDPGIVVEDKTHSVTIHYRQARNRRRAIAAVGRAVKTLADVRVVGGAEAVNLLPRNGAHKGIALRQALRLFACDTAIYVGDDETDEDAFSAVAPDRLLAIRVGRARRTNARFHLRTQAEIDLLLHALITLRAQRFGKPAPSE